MQDTLLQVKNLVVDFTTDGITYQAVKNISFELGAGEMLAIVGESGSGKSVTSLSLMGLLPKQAAISGQVNFVQHGRFVDLLSLNNKQMIAIRGKEMAMVFQEPMTSLNPVYTCGYQVMEAILQHEKINRSAAKEKTIALFEKVKLPNPASIIHKYPHQLSGGQKQRVMIAMAISCNPALLIADEPTTALDVTVQKTILELMKELQKQNGLGIILITHDIGLVADIADKVLVMYRGEIVEQGTTADVLHQPRHPYTKALMACRPAMHSRGQRLPVVSDFVQDDFSEVMEPLQKPLSLIDKSLQLNIIPPISTFKNPVLEVNGLQVYYPGKKTFFGKAPDAFKAVDNVSFSVNKGETVGLVGESGCGKTTLGRAILNLIPITAGKIILDGKNIASLSENQFQPLRKNLQIVFQDPYGSLNPRITIGDAILEPMMVHSILPNKKMGKQQVMELLEKVNLLPDHFNRYPHQFSGGQRQRICIARALALNPSFLIFDESVSALDVSVQAQVLNLLNDLKKEFGFTSIFISHDLSVVRYISDRIMVMNKGIIVEEGPADEIYFSPKNEYTRQLIDAIPGKRMVK
jgi:peptide/nickel transport system ATP-binding protein